MKTWCPACDAPVGLSSQFCTKCGHAFSNDRQVPFYLTNWAFWIFAACLVGVAFVFVACLNAVVGTSKTNTGGQNQVAKTGFMAQTPEQNANELVDKLTSTPKGRETAQRLANKDNQLTEFQKANGISDAIAEAAIKEWVMKHGNNFDWDLEDVKAICLRNKRDGIPHDFLPESQKRRK